LRRRTIAQSLEAEVTLMRRGFSDPISSSIADTMYFAAAGMIGIQSDASFVLVVSQTLSNVLLPCTVISDCVAYTKLRRPACRA
jgi:hypothetical protein